MTDEKKIFDYIESRLIASEFKKKSNKSNFNIDNIILHKTFGIFIFLFIIAVTLSLGIYLGQILSNAVSYILMNIFGIITTYINNDTIKDFINSYIHITTESILTCAVQIFSIYLLIYILKESGYLSRGIFLIDRLMRSIGLNGSSFIPIVNNFGCNVPGVLSTRIIKEKNIRLITILISPLISCPAKLPVYFLITSIYFSYIKQIFIILLVYLYGILLAIITSKIISSILKYKNKNNNLSENNTFIEIPFYEIPNIVKTLKISFNKALSFIKHTSHLIVIFTLILWLLSNFPKKADNKNKYIHKISKKIEPIFSPLGFNYKMNLALIGGIFAKETIPAILKTLYNFDNIEESRNSIKNEITLKVCISFIIFCLLYCPCINTIVVIKNELNFIFSIIFTLFYFVLAFFSSFFITSLL